MWNPFDGLELKEGSDLTFDQGKVGERPKEEIPEYLNFLEIDNESEFSETERIIYKKIIPYIINFSNNFHKDLEEIIRLYRSEGGVMSDEIEKYLIDRKVLYPRMKILGNTGAESFLQQTGLFNNTDFVSKEEVLLIFELPKPLAQFWWKGDEEGSMKGVNKNLERAGVEWGRFYHDIMYTVYEFFGEMECEGDIYIERINNCGQHEPGLYYYVWKISNRSSPN